MLSECIKNTSLIVKRYVYVLDFALKAAINVMLFYTLRVRSIQLPIVLSCLGELFINGAYPLY